MNIINDHIRIKMLFKLPYVALVTLISLLLIIGCSKSEPNCSDSKTMEVVKQLIQDKLAETGFKKEDIDSFKFQFEAIRTTAIDAQTGKHDCACDLIVTNPNGTKKVLVTYTSERTEKSGEFYITLNGLN